MIVGQEQALFLAVRDWRRAPRHTALGGPPDGTLRSGQGRPSGAQDPEYAIDATLWEGSAEIMA